LLDKNCVPLSLVARLKLVGFCVVLLRLLPPFSLLSLLLRYRVQGEGFCVVSYSLGARVIDSRRPKECRNSGQNEEGTAVAVAAAM
jgi:hypothetical protein